MSTLAQSHLILVAFFPSSIDRSSSCKKRHTKMRRKIELCVRIYKKEQQLQVGWLAAAAAASKQANLSLLLSSCLLLLLLRVSFIFVYLEYHF